MTIQDSYRKIAQSQYDCMYQLNERFAYHMKSQGEDKVMQLIESYRRTHLATVTALEPFGIPNVCQDNQELLDVLTIKWIEG